MLTEDTLISQPQRIHARFEDMVRTHLLPLLREAIAEQRTFVNAIGQRITEGHTALVAARRTNDKAAFFKAYTEYNQAVFNLIEPRYESNHARSLEDIFVDFAETSQSFLRDIATIYTETQKEDRFVSQAGEKPKIRLVKYAKRQHRRVTQLPWAIQNTFRKLTKKELIAPPLRKYRIPLRNLTRYYYREEWAIRLVPVLEKIYYRIAVNTRQLWRFEDTVYTQLYTHLMENYGENDDWLAQLPELAPEAHEATMSGLGRELDALEEDVMAEVEAQLILVGKEYADAYDRVGTAELPVRRFGRRVLRRHREQSARRVLVCTQGWRNTLYALHEDWRIDQEVNLLCTTLFNEHTRLKESLQEKTGEAIVPQIERMVECINGVSETLNHQLPPEMPVAGMPVAGMPVAGMPVAGMPVNPMQQTLREQREVIDFQLIRAIIPSTVAVLYRQALPAAVFEVYKNIQTAVDTIADKRALVGTNEYDSPIKKTNLDYISPRQIISFESLPKLLSAIDETKERAGKEVLETQKMITEIGQVSYFNLDSALSLYEDTDEDPERAVSIAEEGLQRANKSIDAVREKLQEVCDTIDTAVWEAVKQFNISLVALKSNDYALEIKLRIAKARALERTQALKRQSLDYLKHGIPYAARYTRQQYQRLSETIGTYQQRIGIAPVDATVTTEVSDFLNDTEVAVDRLPYVYQRLYGNRPLEEAVFYEERSQETAILQKAYHSWNRGRYASTMLVGEKGTGATTLINFFLKKLPPIERDRYQVVRIDTSERVYTECALLGLLSSQLPEAHFEKPDDVVDYFDRANGKHIVVWEDMQHGYLRKVGGFSALKVLFELISRTHRQVFWLCACTQYAWDFLDKTTRISDYFEYIIPLDQVSSEQLREAILKRHRVSGYRIQYAGTVADRSRKKFMKMSDEQKQHYLEEMYFEDLTQLTAGNYSIAQLYWLRSTQQVLNDTITIGSLQMMDFSFTKSIPLSQMLILHALLLHDGLSEAHFQEMNERKVSRTPVATHLGLRQLRDDGLVTLKDDIYVVNPLLYRHIVQLLRNKNFLH